MYNFSNFLLHALPTTKSDDFLALKIISIASPSYNIYQASSVRNQLKLTTVVYHQHISNILHIQSVNDSNIPSCAQISTHTVPYTINNNLLYKTEDLCAVSMELCTSTSVGLSVMYCIHQSRCRRE